VQADKTKVEGAVVEHDQDQCPHREQDAGHTGHKRQPDRNKRIDADEVHQCEAKWAQKKRSSDQADDYDNSGKI